MRPAPRFRTRTRSRAQTGARTPAAVTARTAAALTCGAALLAVAAAGCGHSHSAPADAVSPLTGLPGAAGKVLAVKIDNIVYARPQTGLGAAAVVYAIEVEGGLSRFLAVYDSKHLPAGGKIGPVRSARESDLPILEQYGKVDFAYSGALTAFLPVLKAANLFTVSPAQDPGAFSRDPSRRAPYNQYLDPARVLADFPDSAAVKDVGFRFGAAPAGGVPTASVTARMPAASFTFTWDAAKGEYMIAMDGKAASTTDGGPLGAPTVVLQKVAEATSPRGFHDVPGQLSPYAPTVGNGEAVVLRDGAAYTGTWSRPRDADVTSFIFDGRPMPFHPGQVWIVLTPK